jgi:threonine dehydrogenase-like Zn-dependent dehydrogenase
VLVARLHGKGNVRLRDEERPEPAAGMSLLRVTDVGLCGSDLHWFAEGASGMRRSANARASLATRSLAWSRSAH